ncbi:hypothetical protein [Labedaea rhizosphaerae]|uniref:Uncharacterized protein n=1 Tax=Labedaea rhizosphaerae TaxID=598644 RepID=A0A4R6SC40_LABRH|nr:hypothetical protein [Labedaea rhizosphaerae]TDP97629.1 hypothetical protein EV186_103593 [Labedaea rhizosphaerae]
MPGEMVSLDLVPARDRNGRETSIAVGHTDDGWLAIGPAEAPMCVYGPGTADLLEKIHQHLSATI